MAEWPTLAEVEHEQNLGDDAETQSMLQHDLDAAIEAVKHDVGNWDEDTDEPDERLRKAALRAVTVLRDNAPDDGWRELRKDRIYVSLIFGHRRTFGIS